MLGSTPFLLAIVLALTGAGIAFAVLRGRRIRLPRSSELRGRPKCGCPGPQSRLEIGESDQGSESSPSSIPVEPVSPEVRLAPHVGNCDNVDLRGALQKDQPEGKPLDDRATNLHLGS